MSITRLSTHFRRAAAITLAVLVAALVGRYVYSGVRPNVFPKRFGIVDEGKVYRSGQLTPAAFESVVESRGIRTIIDLGSTIHSSPEGELRNQRTADSLGVTRYVFRLHGDSTGNPNAYVQALRLAADPANQPVLVHCGAGAERTGLFCILYKNIHFGTPLEDGFAEAQTYGHRPRRTPEMRQMMNAHSREIIEKVRDGGQIQSAEVEPLPEPRAEPSAAPARP